MQNRQNGQNNQNKQNQSGELDALIKLVSQKMGKSPEELKREMESGSLQQSDQVKELLGDKERLNSFLNSPQVQQFIRELGKK